MHFAFTSTILVSTGSLIRQRLLCLHLHLNSRRPPPRTHPLAIKLTLQLPILTRDRSECRQPHTGAVAGVRAMMEGGAVVRGSWGCIGCCAEVHCYAADGCRHEATSW